MREREKIFVCIKMRQLSARVYVVVHLLLMLRLEETPERQFVFCREKEFLIFLQKKRQRCRFSFVPESWKVHLPSLCHPRLFLSPRPTLGEKKSWQKAFLPSFEAQPKYFPVWNEERDTLVGSEREKWKCNTDLLRIKEGKARVFFVIQQCLCVVGWGCSH